MLQSNEIVGGIYRVIKPIGHGGAGTIYLAIHLHLNKYVVLKRVHTGSGDVEKFRRESDILKNLHHTYLPQIYDFVVRKDEVFTVMDYIEGYDLDKYPAGTGYLKEAQLLRYFRQMAVALEYLESQKPPVIHSDIKPANIILRGDNTICLIDFNISLFQTSTEHIQGMSPYFASPEQINQAERIQKGYSAVGSLDIRTDIYSLGATFYYLMTGVRPDGRTPVPALGLYKNLPYSGGFTAIIDKCMQWNRELRYPNAKKLLKAIDSIKKQDRRYRTLLICQAASILVGAAILSFGAFCLIRGYRMAGTEEFLKQLSALQSDTEAEGRETKALSLLNNQKYEDILSESPEAAAVLNHIIGDIYYDRGDFYSASDYYETALRKAEEAGINTSDYYRDLGLAYAYDRNYDEARAVLSEAEAAGSGNDSQTLILAVIDYNEGQYDTCLEKIEDLMSGNASPDIKGRAALLGADLEKSRGQYLREIEWLDAAGQYMNSAKIYREKARAWADLTGAAKHPGDRQRYAEEALKCYSWLEENGYFSLTDKINRALVYRMKGDDRTARRILEECQEDDPDNFTVLMYLAFTCNSLGDTAGARSYAEQAREAFDRLSSAEQSEVDPEAVRELDRILNG